MKFISIGTIDIKFLIPVVGGLVGLIYRIFIVKSPKLGIIKQNPFLRSMYVTFGMILALIPLLIIKYKSKVGNDGQIIKSEYLKQLKDSKDAIKKTKCKKFRFILYSTIFDFLQTLLAILFILNIVYNLWIFDIIIMSLFSFLILKTKYYKHQFISMFIIVVLGFGLNIIKYFQLDDIEDKLNAFDIFIHLISEIIYCLVLVIRKYNMEINYCNPYELCFLEGVLLIIFYSICLGIFCRYELSVYGIPHPDNLIQYFDEYDYNDFIVCLAIIITHFIYSISIILTCDYFTPIHILIISIINESIRHLIPDSNWTLNILGIFILLLITITFLVFIEVIEINICNLSYNTKKNIELIAKKDALIEYDYNNFPEDESESNEVRKLDTVSSNYSIYN